MIHPEHLPDVAVQIRQVSVVPLGLAFLVETSQLYHVPWIDSIRKATFGGLVLGYGFLWTDLVRYSVCMVLGVVAESAVVARVKTFEKV